MQPRALFDLCKQAVMSWKADYAPSMGAALAYYTVFSVAPLLLIVISVAGLVFGQEAARGEIMTQLSGLMGEQGARAVQGMLEAVNKPKEGIVATVIGIALLLVGATTVFGELQDALDRIWRAPARDDGKSWLKLLRVRLLSFSMIMGIGFLLMVSLVASAALAALSKWWAPVFGGWAALAQGVNFVFSFVDGHRGLRDDLQDHAARARAVARRVGGRGGHGAAVHRRQAPDRPVHRQEQRGLGLRRRGLAGGGAGVGLLLGADLPAGRGIHLGVCAQVRVAAASGAAAPACHSSRARERVRASLRSRLRPETPAPPAWSRGRAPCCDAGSGRSAR